MRIRLFPNPFWRGELTSNDSTLAQHLERVGVASDQINAAVRALGQNTEAEIDCPDSINLRNLADDIPNLTVELID